MKYNEFITLFKTESKPRQKAILHSMNQDIAKRQFANGQKAETNLVAFDKFIDLHNHCKSIYENA